MDLLFGYIAGILTLINPCILPVLPIVLGASIQNDRRAPLLLALGLCITFVSMGMLVATVGHSIGLTETRLAQIGSILMIGFGLVLLIPKLNQRFVDITSGISAKADDRLTTTQQNSTIGIILGGMLLGLVWSPCIGPTLGGAISMASQGQNLIWAFMIMLSFALGVSTIIIALGYGTREIIRKRQTQLRALAERSKVIMGLLFIAIGLVILFQLHHFIEGWLVAVLPEWLQDFSVKY